MEIEEQWPIKQREVQNHHADSRIWNDFQYRDDDIVIATYAKSGTTWMQQIVSQLLFDGQEGLEVARMSPCLELRFPERSVKLRELEAQSHRRFIKTHLPVDALVFSPLARYVHVARDGRDVVWSMHHHHASANELWYEAMNNTPGRAGPPLERPTECVRSYFLQWLERDGHPFWPFWSHARSWWSVRRLPNVLMVHYAELKRDMPGQIRRVADFLRIPVRAERWPHILRHCSFEYMKEHATGSLPMGGKFWDGGARTFVNRGINDRWRDVLSADDIGHYESIANRELGSECARWYACAKGG